MSRRDGDVLDEEEVWQRRQWTRVFPDAQFSGPNQIHTPENSGSIQCTEHAFKLALQAGESPRHDKDCEEEVKDLGFRSLIRIMCV